MNPHVQKFIVRDGINCCADCKVRIIDGTITHLSTCGAVCRGHSDIASGDYEIELELDLSRLGLQHSRGRTDNCRGLHPVITSIDLMRRGLHHEDECRSAEIDEDSVQAVHAALHPKGTRYSENCREPICRDLRGNLP